VSWVLALVVAVEEVVLGAVVVVVTLVTEVVVVTLMSETGVVRLMADVVVVTLMNDVVMVTLLAVAVVVTLVADVAVVIHSYLEHSEFYNAAAKPLFENRPHFQFLPNRNPRVTRPEIRKF
jgi:hypothetical protein